MLKSYWLPLFRTTTGQLWQRRIGAFMISGSSNRSSACGASRHAFTAPPPSRFFKRRRPCGEPTLSGSLVQKPECEIDREPELKKADSLLLGNLHLGR